MAPHSHRGRIVAEAFAAMATSPEAEFAAAGAGAKAIATTSAGVAWSLGVPDGAGLGAKRAAAVIARMLTSGTYDSVAGGIAYDTMNDAVRAAP